MLELALPWGMSYMIPQNGYHPLYSYLLRNHPPEIKLNCLDDVKTRHNLKDRPLDVDRLVRKGKDCLDKLPPFFAQHFKSETLLLELGLAAEIPGDIEFVHTSPMVTGTRPFILHIESLFSLFLPFEENPAAIIDDAFELKVPMRELLASNNCVGIYSHLNQTVHEIAVYFNCPTIESKLSHIPIGFDDGYQRPQRKTRLNSSPRFLVICSASQAPNTFIDCGGVIVLEAWEKLRHQFPDSQLIWQSQRPSPSVIEYIKQSNIVDADSLLETVTWIERQLSDRELDHLFAYADFVLIPSLELHSTTVLKALANECIPIVSDIPQWDEFRENGGLYAIEGIGTLNWREKNGVNIPGTGLSHTPSIVNKLVETVEKLWKDCGISARRHSASAYNTFYNGKACASKFYEQVLRFGPKATINGNGAVDNNNTLLTLRGDILEIATGCSRPNLQYVTDPVLLEEFELNETFESLKKHYNSTIPKLVFAVGDRVHSVSFMNWPALISDLANVSAYSNLKSDDYDVFSSSSNYPIIEMIQKPDNVIALKYRQFLKKREQLIKFPESNLGGIDIELVSEHETFNLLRVYHLFVCYEKSKGPFPAEEFIKNPLNFSRIFFLRKELSRLDYCKHS